MFREMASYKKKYEKFFRNYFSNVVIFLLIAVMVLGFYCSKSPYISAVSNSEYNGTIYAGDKNSNKVSLMVNVYWGNEPLVKMLDIFKKYNIN